MVHIKEPLLLIGKSSQCSGSSLSDFRLSWYASFTGDSPEPLFKSIWCIFKSRNGDHDVSAFYELVSEVTTAYFK